MMTVNKDEKKAILDGLIDLFGQNRRWLLFFGTGTSCALDRRFGMPALEKHLKKELSSTDGWPQVESKLASGQSLEEALTGVGLPPTTKALIQEKTGDYVAEVDRRVRNDVLLGKKRWVGERLLKALTQRLPPRNPRLPVVTANYDMLIEYACASHGIRCTTGFLGDLIRVWNWDGVQDSLNQCRASQDGSRTTVHTNRLSRVELFKVHGSINRFVTSNGQVECDLWVDKVPAGCSRVIAAPGDQKYEGYAGIIDTAKSARDAECGAMAFAVIGYGFNDHHLHQQIFDRVKQQNCPLLVLTRDLAAEKIEELGNLGTRVWILVTPMSGAGKSDEASTAVYMPGRKDPFVMGGERLWSCDSFAEVILGG